MSEEREPAPRKFMTFKGDQVDGCRKRHYFGPTTQGRVFRLTHAEYDPETDTTRAVLAPVGEYELNAVLEKIQQMGGRL